MTTTAPIDKAKARLPVAWVIAGLFIASGIVRFAGGTAEAIALEMGEVTTAESHKEEKHPADADLLDQVFSELRDREEALNAREDALEKRAQELEGVSQTARLQLEELSLAEERLRETLALARRAAENDVSQLTSVYASMKPKEAAAVFEEMAPEFAAGFLGRMPPEAAGRIIAGLKPSTAYSISVILAGRNVKVPTE